MTPEQPEVLFLAGRFEVRGSSMQAINLARHLPVAGFEISILCRDAALLPASRRGGLNVAEVHYLDLPLLGRLVRRLLLREIAREPPDLLHVLHRSAMPLGQWLARRIRRPLVVSIHDHVAPRELPPHSFDGVSRVIAVSESVRTELVEQFPSLADRLVVIPSGVDLPPEEELRPPFDSARTPVVGTAGPLEAAKGLHVFLRAIPLVLAERRPVEFLIAGAGPEEQSLRRLADELQVTEFLTFVPNVFDLSASLAAMDIYCLPSLKQGLGTIMLEAMARARPVIASKVGGVYGVVSDGETGLLAPPSDAAALAARIVELLRDPERARRIGAAARRHVEAEYPVSRMTSATAAVYRELLSGR